MKTLVAISMCLALAGCQSSRESEFQALDQWEGAEVTIQFKRDMLGASGDPVAPTATGLNNTLLSLGGRIISSHKEGLFLDSQYRMNQGDTDLRHSEFWIPSESILAIEKKL